MTVDTSEDGTTREAVLTAEGIDAMVASARYRDGLIRDGGT
jgi:hypothetical protein